MIVEGNALISGKLRLSKNLLNFFDNKPASNSEGLKGEIRIYEDGGVSYLAYKNSSGVWKAVPFSLTIHQ